MPTLRPVRRPDQRHRPVLRQRAGSGSWSFAGTDGPATPAKELRPRPWPRWPRWARSARGRIIARDSVAEAAITVHAALAIAGDLARARRELAVEVGTLMTAALGAG
jgi:hypothetical protein